MVANSRTPALNFRYPADCGSPTKARVGIPRGPSSRSPMVMRKTWSRSTPMAASTWKSMATTPCGKGTSKLMDPSDAKSSGPISEPSGLLPKPSLRAVSSVTAVRRGTRGPAGCPKPRTFGGCAPAPTTAAAAAPCSAAGATVVTCPPGDCPRPGAPGAAISNRGIAPEDHGLSGRAGIQRRDIQEEFAGARLRRTAAAGATAAASRAVEIEVMGGFGLEGRVVEDEGTFVACAARRHIAPPEQPAGPGGEEFLQLFAAGACGRDGSRMIAAAGRRQLPPPRHHFRGRVTQRRLVDYRPDVLGKARADPLANRQILQADVGIAERPAMLVAPGDVEDFSVLLKPERNAALAGDRPEAVGRVDILDARDGGKLEARSCRGRCRTPAGRRR